MPKMSAIDLKALLSAERYDALSAMAASKLSDERASSRYRQRQAGCLRTSAQIIPMPEGGPDPQTAKIMVETTVSPQPCRMSLPTMTGFLALTMRVRAIMSSREHTTRECRRKPRKYLIKRGPDSSTSALIIGVMNMIGFTENTIRRPGSS